MKYSRYINRPEKKVIYSILLITCLIVLLPGLYGNMSWGNNVPSLEVVDCYIPIEGGFQINMTTRSGAGRLTPGDQIGVIADVNELNRRPLYPPADRSMIWSDSDLELFERYPFRPVVLAFLRKPFFVFDYHLAGGILGNLMYGLADGRGNSRWFHDFQSVSVRYIDGRLEYELKDPVFPELTVSLSVVPASETVGIISKLEFSGDSENMAFIWAYGGASAIYTHSNHIPTDFFYSPANSSKDIIRWEGKRGALVRTFDDDDLYSKQIFAIHKFIPDYQAVMNLYSSAETAQQGFCQPATILQSPQDVIDSTQWHDKPKSLSGNKCVAVEYIPIQNNVPIYTMVAMGGNLDRTVNNLKQAYQNGLQRNNRISNRIVIDTPDPYLNSAVTTMAFSTEGLWGDNSILHGAWSWRMAYAGWRGWYGPLCYGAKERIRKTIRSHIQFSTILEGPDEGGLDSLLEYTDFLYYNMNEVFLDQVRAYFDYTNDIELMREIYPSLVNIVRWETRRLQPEKAHLYENALNTWISDSHWYIRGQCTQASAYMLRAHEFLANLAERLGEDPVPFQEKARKIRKAMQDVLWMPEIGVFAEYKDTLGNRLLHPEPELPTIYHSAEFGAADDVQIYQMTEWVNSHLRKEHTPGGGLLFWSSNWFPNNGRSFSHSTYDLVYAENLNFAMTCYQAGRANEAYSILRATLAGIFNNPTPGGLSCHTDEQGLYRSLTDEFADAISMWGKTVVEGLFGIKPCYPEGRIDLCPQLPKEWTKVSIKSPHLSYSLNDVNGCMTLEWKSPVPVPVNLRYPLQARQIQSVLRNGKSVPYKVVAGIGLTWLEVINPVARSGKIELIYEPSNIVIPETQIVSNHDHIKFDLSDYSANGCYDPQGVIRTILLNDSIFEGDIDAPPGPALMFLNSISDACPLRIPMRLIINNPQVDSHQAWKARYLGESDIQKWYLIDLENSYNEFVTGAVPRMIRTAVAPEMPASQIGFEYWLEHIVTRLKPGFISDQSWRNKLTGDGLGWTTDGIPFKSQKQGKNIAAVSLVGDFPRSLNLEVNARGEYLYLMMSGITFPNQSHVVNVRIKLSYENDVNQIIDLVNPFTIGDCWSSLRFHDTPANGFENIGGRFGPAGSSEVEDLGRPIRVDTEAHLIELKLKEDLILKSIEIEAIANDICFGLMGATIRK